MEVDWETKTGMRQGDKCKYMSAALTSCTPARSAPPWALQGPFIPSDTSLERRFPSSSQMRHSGERSHFLVDRGKFPFPERLIVYLPNRRKQPRQLWTRTEQERPDNSQQDADAGGGMAAKEKAATKNKEKPQTPPRSMRDMADPLPGSTLMEPERK